MFSRTPFHAFAMAAAVRKVQPRKWWCQIRYQKRVSWYPLLANIIRVSKFESSKVRKWNLFAWCEIKMQIRKR